MSMPTETEWFEFAKVLIQWGGYAILYGIITIIIGLAMIAIIVNSNSIKKLVNETFLYIENF